MPVDLSWGEVAPSSTHADVRTASTNAGIVGMRPTPATIPHPSPVEAFAALHWHAGMMGCAVADVALIYDALYDVRGWGHVHPRPRLRLPPLPSDGRDSSSPPQARLLPLCGTDAVARGRAAITAKAPAKAPSATKIQGGTHGGRFNKTTVVLKTSAKSEAELEQLMSGGVLPSKVAWSIDLCCLDLPPAESESQSELGLQAMVSHAAAWFARSVHSCNTKTDISQYKTDISQYKTENSQSDGRRTVLARQVDVRAPCVVRCCLIFLAATTARGARQAGK